MDYNEHGFLEELLALRNDHWRTTNIIPTDLNGQFNNSRNDYWNFECFDNYPLQISPNSSLEELHHHLPIDQCLNNSFTEFYSPFGDEVLLSEHMLDTTPFPIPEDYPFPILEENNGIHKLDVQIPNCKVESSSAHELPNFNMGMGVEKEKETKAKKMEGQPSKNLMAERRRRKRLNDRLSMLRSIVPKISKMDRTSILGDTIDYMKELVERINNLQEEKDQLGSNQFNLISIFKDVKPNEVLVRNSPKFEVERREKDSRIEICCSGKPGLLLTTVSTLEALGLEIQQCVISCFNDFAMQASCSEVVLEQRGMLSSEDIKQALFRNAGYGGRCV